MVLANFCASGSSFWITMIIFSRISKSSFPGFLFFPRSRFNILQSILLYLEDNIQLQGFVSLVCLVVGIRNLLQFLATIIKLLKFPFLDERVFLIVYPCLSIQVSKDEDSECREDLDSDRREDFVGVTFF
ncbi:uncharacterized protein LOC131333102 isoform X1 [Rhododendron vialii]|uniref:uncharacterized protein LOC131333102 isoform X1 n=1 Tax=Rhododendron vialii TaxID=182163 RepID=UPI00265E3C4B|nr:uncharacterized protein LOC131333102 isoform X1 [Rhododendron vialii]XP_058223425.1 uncharacterized protein LOC131333102 isoform X1 [Rhododendron vialii]